MNIKALITMLVLGTSSAAVASPTVEVSANAEFRVGTYGNQPVIRDHRYREPVYVPQYRTQDRRWNDDRFARPSNVKLNSDSSEYTGPIYDMRRGFGWSTLTDPTHIEMSRQIIRLDGRFGGLMLQNVTGTTQIKMVKIRFANGQPDQTIVLNKSLGGWSSNLFLNVQRAPIQYIVVYGTSHAGSSYRVLGA